MQLTGAGFVAWFRGVVSWLAGVGRCHRWGFAPFRGLSVPGCASWFPGRCSVVPVLAGTVRQRHGPGPRDRRLIGNSGTGEVSVTWVVRRRNPARQWRAPSARRPGEFGVRTAAVRRRTAAVQVGTVTSSLSCSSSPSWPSCSSSPCSSPVSSSNGQRYVDQKTSTYH